MKSILCLALFTVVGLMILNAECRSMPKCPSECEECAPVNCECGTFKDVCNCCDICLSCPDQSCSLIRGDVCTEGYTCAHPAGTDYLHRMNSDGKCVRTEDAPEESV